MEEVVLKKFLKTLSPFTGIAGFVSGGDYINGDAYYHSYGAINSDISIIVGKPLAFKISLRSSGGGLTINEALFSTFGELVERYSSCFYNKNDLIFSSYKRIKDKAIDINEISLFHEEQYKQENFPFVKLDENLEIHWTHCYDITENEYKLYPARLVYMPFLEKEPNIGFTTSNGLSNHTNFFRAVLNGLYEIIERDAFMLAWAGHLDLPKIKINKELESYIRKIFPPNYEFHFIDITSDLGIPSIWVIVKINTDFGDCIFSATSCRGTYSLAIKKVLKEVGQVGIYIRALVNERRKNGWNPSFEDVKSFDDCMAFYNIKKEYIEPAFGKYLNKEPDLEVNFNENEKELKEKDEILSEIKRIIKIFKQKHYNVLIKDMTSPDIRELGFYVVRIISPQLVPIHAEYKYPLLGSRRIYELTGKHFHQLNKFPYPFP